MPPRSKPRPDQPPAPPSPRRKWTAIAIATLIEMVSYWAIVIAFVNAASEEDLEANAAAVTTPLTIGLLLVPFVFIVLAYVSLHPRPGTAALYGVGLSFLAVPVSLLAGDPITGLAAGYGAGAAAALRPEEIHATRSRIVGVAIAAFYAWIALRVLGVIGFVLTPFMPIAAVGFADRFVERRLAAAAAAGDEGTAPDRR